MKQVIGIFIVVFLIISLYLCILSFLLYLLGLIPILEIQIEGFYKLLGFSVCVMLWAIPFEIINLLLASLPKNSIINKGIILVNIIFFTFYIIWLDSRFTSISFSTLGMVCYIIVLVLIAMIIQIGGEKIAVHDKRKS
ncbi:hypothetical protein KHA94_17875 [Bacillus sp. FJAT-49705]|uniref:Regulatory protein YrvL n=1 Tax=Cytobacillus citreus TaxID=2833586 RepID=A0ABS5NWR2_9BACI|nr:hypothetical protein [Cytobacillus citreus]MBS4192036.1 hypothetical protein [Cytobacillus citreus]